MPTRARSTGAAGDGDAGSQTTAAGTTPSADATTTAESTAPAAGTDAAAGAETGAADAIDLTDPSLYINRELSMLAFQRRVLEEARDERNPLLERVKFLSILGSNLGEFFMVRVAGLRQQVEAGVADLSADGMTPAEQLVACREQAYAAHARGPRDLLLRPHAGARRGRHPHPRLRRARRGASARPPTPTSTATSSRCSRRSPSTPGRPFPHISNLSLNLAVLLRDENGEERFARVKVPSSLPRLVPVPAPEGSAGRRPRRAATTSSGSSSSSPPTSTSSSPA